MNYTDILKRAARITWRHRALWLFGILLAVFGGRGGNSGQGIQYQLNGSDLERWGYLRQPDWALVAAVALGLLALILVLIVVSIIVRYLSIGALIGMVDEVERDGSTSVRSGFRAGWARFLRLLAISLLLGVPAVVVFVALLLIVLLPLPLVIVGAQAHSPVLLVLGLVAMFGLFLLWLLLVLAASAVLQVLLELMYRRCVLAGEGVFGSIREGYRMARRNLRDAGLTWLLLFGIGLIVGVVLLPVALLALALTVGAAAAAWALSRAVAGALVVGLPLLLVVIAGLVFVAALWLIFQSAVWTLVYREIDGREHAAALPEA